VLAGGTAAAAGAAVTFVTGLPVLAPALRDQYDLSLAEVGLLLAAAWVGSTLTLLPWGLAADRFGERAVLALGLSGSAIALVGAGFVSSFWLLLLLLAVAGASGSSVNSASGRAVMQWFGEHERGLALGIRQTAIPLGGLVGALAVPPISDSGGPRAGLVFLGICSAVGAVIGVAVMRSRDAESGVDAGSLAGTLADKRLWRLCVGSGIYLYAQVAILGFTVVFLHDEHGLSETSAALVLALAQVFAVGLRIGAGRWSDVSGSRIAPLRLVGLAMVATLVLTAVFARGPLALLVVALTLAGALSMGWNGLSFAAAAELAGARRSGASIGFQQTVLSAIGVGAPVLFAATVSAASWTVAFLVAAVFPLVGWRLLRPLRQY
jgi:sugar phosphate permease